MGGLAEIVGIETSFYLVGVIATILMGTLVIHVKRSSELTESNKIFRDEQ